ncbi:hypothetical protein [Parahaliea aestuarii]|uniref:Uncharacterized protein n=1 Tax=Parahaliea aestuarii TaxID=1852021 RepID=A0A5C8ZXG7_9GAMM|nr:hypothetical protein [Parahaliea aestuarii]TXS93215.1 hypothetical protein FVW59_05045 [Parahaliea aestuarii]
MGRNGAAGTQSVALNAIVFVKTKVLGQAVGDLSGFQRSRRQPKLPVVLARDEVEVLFAGDRSKEHYAGVWLPHALARKYPNAPRESKAP